MSEQPADGSPRRGRALFAVAGGALLALAMPGVLPAVLSWLTPLLVLPGLMAAFALLSSSPRPRRDGYLFGCVFMAGFSWSVHHVMFAAYAAIVLVGGLYFLLAAYACEGLRRGRVVAFALAIAAAFWLRAMMPEIYYPHGQPVHALFEWPLLLRGTLALGGEPLANALLAALAAALVEAFRGWRTAQPPYAAARRQLLLTASAILLVAVGGHWLRTQPLPTGSVRIAAVEPGLHPIDPYLGLEQDPDRAMAVYQEIVETRLLAPTRELLARPQPPELVLWPESALPTDVLPAEQLATGRGRIPLEGPWPDGNGRLVLGALVARGPSRIPGAFVVDPRRGVVLGHQEKLWPVPGGEFLPFAGLLPDSLGDPIRQAFAAALGTPPDGAGGQRQPLLETAAGQRFGALICYDNAFPGPSAELAAAGAEFLVVLSNEAWYRGGAELAQLVAQTVCRALEVGLPLVRCTTDGRSLVIDRDGRITAELAPAQTPTPAARTLLVTLPIGPRAETPIAWLRGVFGPLAAIWLGCRLLSRWLSRLANRRARRSG